MLQMKQGTGKIYLTSTYLFQEAIAYLPLVVLISATISTGITKKLIGKIGNKVGYSEIYKKWKESLKTLVQNVFSSSCNPFLSEVISACVGFKLTQIHLSLLAVVFHLGWCCRDWSCRVVLFYYPVLQSVNLPGCGFTGFWIFRHVR